MDKLKESIEEIVIDMFKEGKLDEFLAKRTQEAETPKAKPKPKKTTKKAKDEEPKPDPVVDEPVVDEAPAKEEKPFFDTLVDFVKQGGDKEKMMQVCRDKAGTHLVKEIKDADVQKEILNDLGIA